MTIEELKEKGLIIFEAVAGSVAYGLNTENSDLDIRGVYISPNTDLFSMKYMDDVKASMTCGDLLEEAEHNEAVQEFIRENDSILNELLKYAYKMSADNQVNDSTNDTVYYELGKFLKLVESNNPNILELLNMPEQFVQYKHPIWDVILANKDKFLTKRAGHAFNGYANSQISKARGENKMITNEQELVKKKDMLDFCYVIIGGRTKSIKKWLSDNKREQLFCGLARIDHGSIQKVDSKDNTGLVGGLYALYYDQIAHNCFSKFIDDNSKDKFKEARKKSGEPVGYGFKGIVNEDDAESTNSIRVSNIPKEIADDSYVTNIIFNANGYASHRKDYKKYKDWLDNRNEERYKSNVKGGYKGFDLKNAMHCIRLLIMGEEILEGKGINVYRKDDREYLLSIRNGDVDYHTLMSGVDERMERIRELYKKSNLPDKIDRNILDDILIEMRTKFYKEKGWS